MKNEEKTLIFIQSELRLIFETNYFHKQINTNQKYGITLEIRTKENGYDNKPHCHARYEGKYISISLVDYSILEQKGIKKNMQKRAVELVKEYRDELNKLWTEFHGKIEL